MPDRKKFEGSARCPFYIAVGLGKKPVIICEGCFGESQKLFFDSSTKMQQVFEKFCVKRYESCPYYRATYTFKYSNNKEKSNGYSKNRM